MFKSTLIQQYIQGFLENSSCGDSTNSFKGKWIFFEARHFLMLKILHYMIVLL